MNCLLESVLFADVRFHDTISRARLLNCLGKVFECRLLLIFGSKSIILGIDSKLSDDFFFFDRGYILSGTSLSAMGGLPFIFAAFVFSNAYWNGKHYNLIDY